MSINTFIQYGMYALSTLSFPKHYQSSSPQINQICSSNENLCIFGFITKRIKKCLGMKCMHETKRLLTLHDSMMTLSSEVFALVPSHSVPVG